MSPPLDRRAFIRGTAALGAVDALGSLVACGSSRVPSATGVTPSVDLMPPPGWDYPAVVDLLPFGRSSITGRPEYVDFRDWRNADECARHYALHYVDPDMLKAHQSLAFAVRVLVEDAARLINPKLRCFKPSPPAAVQHS